jgi:hypothetical protein
MAGHRNAAQPLGLQQGLDLIGQGGDGERRFGQGRPAEAGQVRHDQLAMGGEQGQQRRPASRAAAQAMQQKQGLALALAGVVHDVGDCVRHSCPERVRARIVALEPPRSGPSRPSLVATNGGTA